MRRNISLCVTTVVLLLGVCSGAVAQEAESDVSEQLWFDYNPRWTDRSNREIYGDVGFRTELGMNEWVRLVARPGFRGPVGPFRLAGGIGVFYRLNRQSADRLEIRPFQGISAIWPNRKRLRLKHYVRFEERLEWVTDDWTLDASLRGRYQLHLDYSFNGFRSGSDWRVLFHIEGFLTLAGGEGQAGQGLRMGAGVGRNVGSDLRLRADFTWQKAGFELFAGTSDLYVRLRIFQGWLRGLTADDG